MKKKKAQQLVEFLLAAPFIIVFLGILTEYAYALNINLTLNNALKNVTASIYSQIKPSMSTEAVNELVKTNLILYLNDNNIPINSENNITVNSIKINSTTVFLTNYTYYSAFTLPNVFFTFIPEKFEFLASSAVPSVFLKGNNYDSISSASLDGIWSSSISFSAQDGFNAAKKGILKTDSGRNKILFLIPADILGLIGHYILANWNGLIIDSENFLAFSTTAGNNPKIQKCSFVDLSCSDSGENIYSYITANSYTNIYSINSSLLLLTPSMDTISGSWLSSTSTDVSASTVDGILKNVISLTDLNSKSFGNYDNIDAKSYNDNVASNNSFTMTPYGSMIFMKDSSSTLNSIITSGFTANRINVGWSE